MEVHGSLKATQQGFSGSVGINIVILSDFPGAAGLDVIIYPVTEQGHCDKEMLSGQVGSEIGLKAELRIEGGVPDLIPQGALMHPV